MKSPKRRKAKEPLPDSSSEARQWDTLATKALTLPTAAKNREMKHPEPFVKAVLTGLFVKSTKSSDVA